MRLPARVAVLASFVLLGCPGTTTPPASLEISPSPLALDVGESRTITASVKQGDKLTPATGATWTTSDASVVTVSGSANGSATVQGVAAGTATLTAKTSDFTATVSVTVSASTATLSSIEVTPANAELAAGTTGQLTATGIFSDNSTRNITTQVTWNSSNEPVLTVSASGLVTALTPGTATVTATLAGKTATLLVTVTGAALESIALTPTLPSIAAGLTQKFTATGTFADGSTQDLSTQVTWSSSAVGVATVDDEGLARGLAAGTALITATLDGISGGTTLTVTAATLSRIDLEPSPLSLAKGLRQQLTARGHFSDGTTQVVTTQVSWSSDTPTVLNVSAAGEVNAIDVGMATVTATLGSISKTLTVTVTAATLVSLEVTPALPSVALGQAQQFAATGTYSDNTTQTLTDQVTWLSTATTVATVSNAAGSRGLVSTVGAGTAVISASLGAITASTTLTVTNAVLTQLQVTPANPTLPLGVKQTFTATGIFSDGTQQNLTTQVTWATDANTVATISNAAGTNGELTPVAVGTTAVRATQGTITGNTNVTVTAATLSRIDVTPAAPSLAKGRTQQLTATGVYSDNTTQNLSSTVSWSSATTAAVTVNASGLATAVDVGSSIVTATLGAVSGTTTVTVTNAVLTSIELTPATVNLPRGLTQQLVATGRYSDNSTAPITADVTWSSGTPANATVSNATGTEGLVTGVAVGSTVITATLGGVSGTLTINVVAATLQSIAVTPANPSVAKGRTQQLVATGTFSDGSNQNLTAAVTWTSATPARVTVSNASGSQGLATALDVGSSVVTATLSGVSGSTTLTVTNAVLTSIAVTPATRSIARGLTQQYVATGTFSDTTQQNITAQVTWSSGTPATATISNATGSNGLATAVAQGTSVITAALGGISGTANLTVTAASLVSLTVTPSTASIPAGRTQQYTATGTYTDATNQDLTATVTWTTGTPATATISNAAGSRGLATGVAMGSSTVVATLGGVTGTANLTVTPAVLESITVAPATVSVVAGATTQLTASGHYSDGSQLDLTTSVTWSSDATARATVSNAAGSQGLVTGVTAGTANVSATQGTVTSAAVVTVTPAAATLVSIAVTPANPSVALGRTQQFVATGTYSDSSSADLSATVTWASATTSVATINATGLATSVSQGTSVVSATLGAVSGSTTLTVGPAVVVSVAVTPASPTVARGLTQQFTATATYSDGSALDVSATATWASATPSVATISASGLATGVAEGTSVISALVGGLSGSTTLTVGPAVLVSIDVAPNPLPVTVGGTDVVSVTGTYSDGSLASVAATATYTPADASIATVSGGTVSGHAAGSTVITVAVGAVSTTFTVNVTAVSVTLTSITINGSATLKNVVTKFTATGHYSDGSTQDVTTTATWASSTAATASVSNLAGRQGEVTPLAAGTTNVTATIGSVTGTLAVTGVATTPDSSRAVNHLVISQVYGGGGSGSSAVKNDFIELHNPTDATISVSGLSVQYTSSAGTTWQVTALDGGIPPGGYYLVQEGGGATGANLPSPDAVGAIAMSATAGKVVLATGTAALTGGCPTAGVIDTVGYGAGTNCSEGTVTATPSATTAIIRVAAGCRDTGNNATDLPVGTPAPRNSASARVACDYFVNDFATAATEELNYCAIQFPSSLSVAPGGETPLIYARVFHSGVTEAAGAASNVVVQIGYGASMSSPLSTTSWKWQRATYNVQVGNDDEYQASFLGPAAASYSYAARASLDGVNWTACDLNGAGSNSGLDFETSQLGVMTVTP